MQKQIQSTLFKNVNKPEKMQIETTQSKSKSYLPWVEK